MGRGRGEKTEEKRQKRQIGDKVRGGGGVWD
jgi:hypothetical protein